MSSDIVIDEGNADLTTEQPTAANVDMQYPLVPIDGMVCAFRTDNGVLLHTFTKERWDELGQNEEIDRENLGSLRAAIRSLSRIEDHEILPEYVASAAAYFGDEAGMPILREYVDSCLPQYVNYISDLWCEACEQRGDTFEDWEKASHEPGGWRWLVRLVRELKGGDEPPKPSASAIPDNSSLLTGGVKLICGADIEPEPIEWLWPGWLASGKLHIIAGAPGCGKTTDALSFAATLTSGGEWPDGTRAPVCNALMFSAEDDIKNTLLPRFMSMGGNRKRIHFVKGADGSREFDPSTDMAGLRAAAEKLGNVGLIIVDPIVSAVTGDSHKNTEVRRSLQPLVDLAQSLNAVLLGITHFSKGTAGRDPIDRVNGSLAFGAVARLVFAAAKVKSEETGEAERIFVRAKSNIGPDGGGFKFDLVQVPLPKYPNITASTVVWGESLEGTARDLLKEAEGAGESSKSEDAAELIQETIRTNGGEASANDLHAALKAAGIGRNSRYRAIDGLLEQHRIARVRYVENGPWTYLFQRRGGVADVSSFDPAASDSAANVDLVGEVTT